MAIFQFSAPQSLGASTQKVDGTKWNELVTYCNGLPTLGANTFTAKQTINQTAAANALKITQSGDAGASTSVGGAINVTNTSNDGAGIVVYSNAGASALGHLIAARVDNVLFPNSAIYATSAGASHTGLMNYTGTDATSAALNLTSSNPNFTTLGVSGVEEGHGTIKISHTKPTNSDANAAALSIDLKGTGTAAQGIFITSTASGGTTGDILDLRNGTLNQLLKLTYDGKLGLGVTNPTEILHLNGNMLLGSNKIKTTNGIIKEISATVIGVRNAADSAYTSFRCLDLNCFTLRSQNGTLVATPSTTNLQLEQPLSFNGNVNITRRSLTTDPTSTEIPSGEWNLFKNTTNNATKIWYNDGGTITPLNGIIKADSDPGAVGAGTMWLVTDATKSDFGYLYIRNAFDQGWIQVPKTDKPVEYQSITQGGHGATTGITKPTSFAGMKLYPKEYLETTALATKNTLGVEQLIGVPVTWGLWRELDIVSNAVSSTFHSTSLPTGSGTRAATYDATYGYRQQFPTGSSTNDEHGIAFGTNIGVGNQYLYLEYRFRLPDTTSRQFWGGWFAADPAGVDQPAGVHIAVRLSTSAGSTGYYVSHSDGTQAEHPIRISSASLASDIATHTVSIFADPDNSRWGVAFDAHTSPTTGGVAWFYTNIPSMSTALRPYIKVRTLTTAAKTLELFYARGGYVDL